MSWSRSRLALASSSFCLLFFCLSSPAEAHWAPRIHHHNARHAINLFWCGNSNSFCLSGSTAWAVAGCETGYKYNVWASNGQYKGIFQMGEVEREKWGHGWNPWAQAKAAHRYYVWSLHHQGSGWYPWECAFRLGIVS